VEESMTKTFKEKIRDVLKESQKEQKRKDMLAIFEKKNNTRLVKLESHMKQCKSNSEQTN
jgi:hypothetical protein